MQVRGLEPGQFLAVTTRRWYKQHQQRYHRELAETIDSLVPQYFRKAVLVANMVDPREQIADDRQTTRELFELIQHKEHVSTLDDDLRPDELVSLYGQSQLVLGTRLHSAIMALSSGTPVLAVSYAGHKTHGLMQLVGFPQYTLDLETFCKAAAVPLVLSALSTREALGTRIAALRQQGDDDFQAAFNNCRAFSHAT
jgi:colanic acid/amylovoran biosynthesis protein